MDREVKEERTGLLIRAVTVIAGIVVVLALVSQCSVDSTITREPAVNRAPEVTYTVDGSAGKAAVTYSNDQGGTQQEDVYLPWTKSMSMKMGEHAYISAQNKNDSGSVKVQILVNGQVAKSSESSGAYVIATASGRCC